MCDILGADMTGRPGDHTTEMDGGSTPSRPLCYACFKRPGRKGAFRLPGATGDHFHCTLEPSPGHFRRRTLVWQERAHARVMQMTQMPFLKPLCLLVPDQGSLRHQSVSCFRTVPPFWSPCKSAQILEVGGTPHQGIKLALAESSLSLHSVNISVCMYIYRYIYMCVCVCSCLLVRTCSSMTSDRNL